MKKLEISLIFFVIFSMNSFADEKQHPNGEKSHFIPNNKIPEIKPQEYPVTCWAASAQAYFRYFGHDVDQQQIVDKITPLFPTTARADQLVTLFNGQKFTDKNGKEFSVKINYVYDGFSNIHNDKKLMNRLNARPMNNDIIRALLKSNRPVFYGTTHHAMVLMSVNSWGDQIISGYAIDPAPNPATGGSSAIGLRPLSNYELFAGFCCDLEIIEEKNQTKKNR
jgi:hypothetical protein